MRIYTGPSGQRYNPASDWTSVDMELQAHQIETPAWADDPDLRLVELSPDDILAMAAQILRARLEEFAEGADDRTVLQLLKII